MSDDLTGRIALVTGGSRGIGRGIAIALARAGADVAVNYRTDDAAAAAACAEIARLGRRAVAIAADVSSATEVGGMVGKVEGALGPIAILVNNAGIARPLAVDMLTEAAWDETVAVNLKSAFLVTQAALPAMRRARWGRVIMIASTAAQTGGSVGPHYAASKAGMIGLMHGYASRLLREGITVNAIAPAQIDTDMVRRDQGRNSGEHVPIGRFGTVGEAAEMAVAIARNGYMTGQTVNLNGGFYFT